MTNDSPTNTIRPQFFATVLLVALVLPVIPIIALNLSADPFQIFFKDNSEQPVFLSTRGKDRYQQAGVVRHYQPDSVIIGHSLAANFQPTAVEKVLGWDNTYNLTMKGSTIHEHQRVARFALENAPVGKVLWLFFPANMNLPAMIYTPKITFPEYLYDNSRLNDMRFFATLPANLAPYIADKAVVRADMQAVNDSVDPDYESRDLATNWQLMQDNRFNAGEEIFNEILGDFAATPAAYKEALAASFPHLTGEDIALLTIDPGSDYAANIELNLRSVAADYPETEFRIIPLPPLAILHWQHLRISQPELYRTYLAYLRGFVRIMADYDNVRIYDYGHLPVAGDMRLYRDHGHYHMAVNEYLLELLAADEGRVTVDTINQYLSDFDALVLKYDALNYQPVSIPGEQSLDPGKMDLQAARKIVRAIIERDSR
jgi:hypothetical protein